MELQLVDPEEDGQILLVKEDYASAVTTEDVKHICVTSQPYQLYDTYAYQHAESVMSV